MPEKSSQANKAPMPRQVSPMLCTLTKQPFDSDDYIYEVKLDGYRIIATVEKGKAKLTSREHENYTARYQPVAAVLADLGHNAVLDGEIVVLDDEGRPDFTLLQQYGHKKGRLVYYVFDILWLDGYDLAHLPLTERKKKLRSILPLNDEVIKYSADFQNGVALYEQTQQLGLEGIVAKLKNSIYTPGRRSKSWLKIPVLNRREYVIGGWAESSGGRSYATLLIGEYRQGRLVYVHHSGSGLSAKANKELIQRLRELEVKRSPFSNAGDVQRATPVHWVRPVLVGQFEQTNKTTGSGKIRHPVILLGIRDDKRPTDVKPEEAIAAPKAGASKQPGSTEEQTLIIEGTKLPLSNIDHAYWHGITKADLIQYYIKVFPYMQPYLHDRPLGLEIVKGAAAEGGEFIRNVAGLYPHWATTYQTDRKHPRPGKSAKIDWLVCNDLATLVFIANLGSIDLHPWNSRTTAPDHPDYLVIDLDPSDGDFKKAVEVALAAKQYLDEHRLRAFIKTSGKTGLHILIPCTQIPYGTARTLAEAICGGIHELIPGITTLNTSVSSRGSKLYVDPSQNDYADRIAATYCVRAHKLPTVSTPIDWKELKPSLDPTGFTIHTIPARLEKKGDRFHGLFNKRHQAANARILRGMI